MRETKVHELTTAALLGSIAGMRSMLAPAVVSRALASSGAHNPARARTIRNLTGVAAVLEAFGDKSSFIPARTNTLPLLGRVASGGLSAFYSVRREPSLRWAAALLGMAAAALSSHALYKARAYASRTLGLPNATAGLLEDALALAAARAASARLTAPSSWTAATF